MSAFVTAMDAHAGVNKRTIPEKPGTVVMGNLEDRSPLAVSGSVCRGELLELWTLLKRGADEADIKARVARILAHAGTLALPADRRAELHLLVSAIVQKRDARKGGGEKDVAFAALEALGAAMPETAKAVVARGLVEFGYVKDLCLLAQREKQAGAAPLFLPTVVSTLARGIRAKELLFCKWAPREKKAGAWLAELVRREMSLSRKAYRKAVAAVTVGAGTAIPETLMSARKFADIEPAHVPSRCLKRARLALIDEDKQGERRRHKGDAAVQADRDACRAKFEAHFADPAKAAKTKGARNFPYELVKDVMSGGARTPLQRQALNAMWAAVVEDVKAQVAEVRLAKAAAAAAAAAGEGGEGGEAKADAGSYDEAREQAARSFDPSQVVAMCDVSGSMGCCDGIPMYNSIALGLILCEIGHPAFRDRVMTFESAPRWVSFGASETFCDRVEKLRDAPWGGSTDFLGAVKLIAEVVRAKGLAEDAVPSLVVFSDMKFDQAMPGTWQTHYEHIVRMFVALGKQVSGRAYEAPRITFWDLANAGDGQPGFPVTASTPGVQLISGFSPALLKVVTTGKRMVTPWETFLDAVLDARYDLVRELVEAAGEIGPAE